MMNTKTKIYTALLGTALIGTIAVAASFNDADKNGDGALSLDELKSSGMDDLVAKFKTLDTDKDGKISKAEAKANR